GTVLALPLEAYGEVCGALIFGSRQPDCYGREDLKVASSTATHLALALHNYRLFTQTQQQARRLSLLSQMAEELNRTTDQDRIFDVAAEKLSSILNVDEAYLHLVDAERAAVRIVTLHGGPPDAEDGTPDGKANGAAGGRAVASRPIEVVPYQPDLIQVAVPLA